MPSNKHTMSSRLSYAFGAFGNDVSLRHYRRTSSCSSRHICLTPVILLKTTG